LYKKSREIQDRTTAEKKRQLKDAIESDKPIPNELKRDEKLLNELEHDDDNTLVTKSHMDDEYDDAKY
jgi:hypothetical protein